MLRSNFTAKQFEFNLICIIAILTYCVPSLSWASSDYMLKYRIGEQDIRTKNEDGSTTTREMIIPSYHYQNQAGGSIQNDMQEYDNRVRMYEESFYRHALAPHSYESVSFLDEVKKTITDNVPDATTYNHIMNLASTVASTASATTKLKFLDGINKVVEMGGKNGLDYIGDASSVVSASVTLANVFDELADTVITAQKRAEAIRDDDIERLQTLRNKMTSSGEPDQAMVDGIDAAIKSLQQDKESYISAYIHEREDRSVSQGIMITDILTGLAIGAKAKAAGTAIAAGTKTAMVVGGTTSLGGIAAATGVGALYATAAVVASDGLSCLDTKEKFKVLEQQAVGIANYDAYMRTIDKGWVGSDEQLLLTKSYLETQLAMADVFKEMGWSERDELDPNIEIWLKSDLEYLNQLLALIGGPGAESAGLESLIIEGQITIPNDQVVPAQSAYSHGRASNSPDLGSISIDSEVSDITVINKTREDLEVNIHSIEAKGKSKSGDITLQGRSKDITVIKKARKSEADVNIGSVVVGE